MESSDVFLTFVYSDIYSRLRSIELKSRQLPTYLTYVNLPVFIFHRVILQYCILFHFLHYYIYIINPYRRLACSSVDHSPLISSSLSRETNDAFWTLCDWSICYWFCSTKAVKLCLKADPQSVSMPLSATH